MMTCEHAAPYSHRKKGRSRWSRRQSHKGQPVTRAVSFVALLSLVVAADTACVRNVRTSNDNFYVINRKPSVAKVSQPSAPALPLVTAHLSDPTTESSLIEASRGPRPKNLLSNAEILEEENPTISFFLRKVQAEPTNAAASFELGRAYHEFRLYDEALRHYQNAVRLEPRNPVYLEQTGRLWRDWRSLRVAADLVNGALDLDPGFVEAWNTLGTIFDRQGDSEPAQNAYLHALSLNPNLDYVHNNLCFSYLQSGMISEAISHGVRATQLNPAMIVAHNNLGLAYGMLGDLDRSIEEFNRSGDQATARNNLGLILLKRGKIAESLEQFKLAARMRPHYKEAAANYRMARDLNFQRRREARTTLRSVERDLDIATAPSVFRLAGIADIGLSLLREYLHLLARQPSVPRPEKPNVPGDIETGQSCTADHREFGGLLGPGFRVGRVLVVPDRLKKTILFYKRGHAEVATELAHRIPEDQAVLRTCSLAPGDDIKIRLGLETSSGNAEGELTPNWQQHG